MNAITRATHSLRVVMTYTNALVLAGLLVFMPACGSTNRICAQRQDQSYFQQILPGRWTSKLDSMNWNAPDPNLLDLGLPMLSCSVAAVEIEDNHPAIATVSVSVWLKVAAQSARGRPSSSFAFGPISATENYRLPPTIGNIARSTDDLTQYFGADGDIEPHDTAGHNPRVLLFVGPSWDRDYRQLHYSPEAFGMDPQDPRLGRLQGPCYGRYVRRTLQVSDQLGARRVSGVTFVSFKASRELFQRDLDAVFVISRVLLSSGPCIGIPVVCRIDGKPFSQAYYERLDRSGK